MDVLGRKTETFFYCENMLKTHKDDLRIYFVRGKGFGVNFSFNVFSNFSKVIFHNPWAFFFVSQYFCPKQSC